VRGPLPENTMAAFARAADEGADGIELDVLASADGAAVVIHDPTLERLTGGRDRRSVARLSAAELARVDLGAGEGVPRLEEVLAWARGRGLLVNVEIKRDGPDRGAIVRAAAAAIRAVPGSERAVLVSSFDPLMLAAFARAMPGVPRGYLFHVGQRGLESGWLARPLRAEAVHPERGLASAHAVARWKRRERLVNAWTVNEVDEARRLAAIGVDAIITDRPGAIAAAVRA
jgi:glycerophosphoryl diester phosphodiesterase